MNNIRSTERINEQELKLALEGASWHDEFKDSAYIFVGGLPLGLTEGDVITIFSQYGEILDISLPRAKETGAKRGFGFLMYEDQRSTVLAVDNLNGAKVLDRIIRVDHVKDYKGPTEKDDEGNKIERTEPSRNAAPVVLNTSAAMPSASKFTSEGDPDLEDPMAGYLTRNGSASGSRSQATDDLERLEKLRRKAERARIREERAFKKERKEGRSDSARAGKQTSESRDRREEENRRERMRSRSGSAEEERQRHSVQRDRDARDRDRRRDEDVRRFDGHGGQHHRRR